MSRRHGGQGVVRGEKGTGQHTLLPEGRPRPASSGCCMACMGTTEPSAGGVNAAALPGAALQCHRHCRLGIKNHMDTFHSAASWHTQHGPACATLSHTVQPNSLAPNHTPGCPGDMQGYRPRSCCAGRSSLGAADSGPDLPEQGAHVHATGNGPTLDGSTLPAAGPAVRWRQAQPCMMFPTPASTPTQC